MYQESDKELFGRVKSGDVKAYESIFKSYYQPLCNYARLLMDNDLEEADEAVQQVFLNVWDKRANIEINTAIQAYLYRAVKNECLNKIKHNKVKRMYQKEMEYSGEGSVDTTNDTVLSKELELKIKEAVGTLPEQCRLIFQLSRFEGKKYNEIAEDLGISPKTVENQIGKALRIMRVQLMDYLPFIALYFSYLIC